MISFSDTILAFWELGGVTGLRVRLRRQIPYPPPPSIPPTPADPADDEASLLQVDVDGGDLGEDDGDPVGVETAECGVEATTKGDESAESLALLHSSSIITIGFSTKANLVSVKVLL